MFAGIDAVALNSQSLAGPFSLIGRGPLQVEASPGLVVHVQAGLLAIRSAWDSREYLVRAGKHFVADHVEAISLESLGHAELRLEWPVQSEKHVSPVLESVGC